MRNTLPLLLVGASCALIPVSAFAELSFISGVNVTRGGEIVAFDNANDLVLTTNSFAVSGSENHGINIYGLSNAGTLSFQRSVDLNATFGAVGNTFSVSSVAVDPLGRDFGVASIIPTANNTTQGRIALFQLSTGAVLNTLDVGYHPDSVSFTPNGSRILVANEGQFVATGVQAPGSVSIVNVSSVGSGASGLAALTSGAHVSDVNFSTGLANNVTLAGVRNNRLDTLTVKTPDALDVEPEYIASTNDKAYVTLQENNAVAVIDLTGENAGKVTAINLLGTITQRIDASDRDGVAGTPATERPASVGATNVAAQVNDLVAGMPMPDTIVTFQKNGVRLIATANEGDFRLDDADRNRISELNTAAKIEGLTAGQLANAGLGRLRVSNIDGDTNGNGKIDVATVPGTRSFTLRDAETGAILFDSGSAIEDYAKAFDLTTFGIELGNLATFDSRSSAKGPEPEALAFGQVNGRDLIFVGAERQNGIFQFDITDLNNVTITGYYNTVTGTMDDGFGAFVSPESIQFVSAADSPTGSALIIVGYEGAFETGVDISGSIAVFGVTAIPEPSTYAAIFGAGALGCALWRRRPRN